MQLEPSQIFFISEIKKQIKAAQYRALQKVNSEQVTLYWNIGKSIVERQQEFGWGKGIVELLATELQKEFVGVQGFSARNLWYMRTFYDQYHKSDLILQPLVAEIPWTHNILIIEKCKNEHERYFYINRTKKFNWSKAVLTNAIETQHYQKTILNQTNFDTTLSVEEANDANFIVKDEYFFDFLNLSEPHSENQLEQAILSNIRNFLTALGGDFSFIGNQFSIKVENKNYEVDLLLFHRELQCLVAIDLKIEEFTPEFSGKMNFYLSILNTKVKKEHERPSIGIIICKSKNRTIVEFALQDLNKPMGVATYCTSPNLPVDMQQFFPTNEEFVERVESITQYINQKRPKVKA